MDGGPDVTRARRTGTSGDAGEALPGWTADQALDLVAQGYSAEQAERLTGFAADWLRARGRHHVAGVPGRAAPGRPAAPGPGPAPRPRPVGHVVTGRELDVLRLAGEGLTTVEIAERLGCSERTVKMALQAVLERFGLRNRTHAVAYAIRAGLI
jgi:DNA-binding CsgD family transcriptional regulator